MWPEVEQAKQTNKKELILDGEEVSSRIKGNGVDTELFTLTDLNFLRLSNTCLQNLDSNISNLCEKLTNLDLHGNRLAELPVELGHLSGLKSLNLSGNSLTSLPVEVCKLSNLITLNISHNEFEILPEFSGLSSLHELYMAGNKLGSLPDGITNLQQLLILQADYNQITVLPGDIHNLCHLKALHLANNSLKELPPSLVLLDKLRTLDLRGNNSISDRRLLKLVNVDQTQPKGVFKFLKPLYDQQIKQSKKGKSQKQSQDSETQHENEEEAEKESYIQVLHYADPKASGLQVTISDSVSDVRPSIICCVLRNLSLDKTETMFKQFIALQTRLHEGICEKRLAATIATHDMKLVKSPLSYEAKNPENSVFVPLGRQKAVTATEFMKKLQKEADEMRKAKKRNTTTGIHKYLDILKGKSSYPFIVDQEGVIISFPPITNCEFTKISTATKDILVEVTSSKSLHVCKQVMEQLILEVFRLGIGTKFPNSATGSDISNVMPTSAGAAGGSEAEEEQKYHCLVVEQVKITDKDGNFKSVYPSKVDLIDVPVAVKRE